MPADVVEKWLRSSRPAHVDGQRLRPLEHSCFKDMPLSIQRGQAEAFCLIDENGQQWILKKFYEGRKLDRRYLEAVSTLLPKGNGFMSGTQRRILSARALTRSNGCYYTYELARWLDSTILMLKIGGIDWATLADEIRDGNVKLEAGHRVTLCENLTELICTMEQQQIAHRDLSSGNVFIDIDTWATSLIDFDSLFHPSLPMPLTTTCGTVGYAPPFAWYNGSLDAALTWCPFADRFALAVLNVEFLLLDKGSPLTAEGGMFDQDELCNRSGKTLNRVCEDLQLKFPAAAPLFTAAVRSKTSLECPSPDSWLQFCDGTGIVTRPPKLDKLEKIPLHYFENLLKKRRTAAPLWPAPPLREMPSVNMTIPRQQVPVVQLPSDPWSDEGG